LWPTSSSSSSSSGSKSLPNKGSTNSSGTVFSGRGT
jgi:hypothetical protein